MGTIWAGLISGALATAPMTLVLVVSRWLGLFRTAPPEQITKNAAAEVGLEEVTDDPEFGPIWLGLHVVFGACSGIGFELVRSFLPRPPVAGGAVYGLIVWAVNYVGLMPVLGLFPSPRQAGRRRTIVMIVAHIVYGMVMGVVFSAARKRG
ncbi:MAG: DUF1440 domain-containing protein [Chloroflexota bacterium]|nr:DUF1440 domain-containing protein [Chloroflexota bacterium]